MNSLKFGLSFFIIGMFISCSSEKATTPTPGSNEIKLFESLPSSKTGVTFVNEVLENPKRHYSSFNPIYDGAGVATGDFNNDGLPDLYFTGNEVPNKLYLNKGDFKFEDITKQAGVAGAGGWTNGVSIVDINLDGFQDIYVCRGGWIKDPKQRTNQLFINQGNLTFKEEAAKYGLADSGYSFQSAFFDYDNDGDLDVYVINHPSKSNVSIDEYKAGRLNGPAESKNQLYRNEGNNKFVNVSAKAGLSNTFGYGLSISTADLDNNGYLDVYVTNDYTEPDYMFLNNGNGTFTESVKERTGHISFFSMGIDIADLDHNGYEDIMVTEMLPEDYKRSKINMASMNPTLFNTMVKEGFHHCYMHNVVQLNRENGYFSDVSQLAGMSKTDWSWACFMTDFDNDGLRDVFVANGYRRDLFDKDAIQKMNEYFKENNNVIGDINEVMDLYHSEKLQSYFFKNNGDLSFSKKIKEWGVEQASFSNGASIADLDNDGDLDLVVNNLNQEAFVYRNNAEKTGNHYLRVKLEGPAANAQGLGAKIYVHNGDKMQMEQLKLNRGYLGTVEAIAHFGLGQATKVDEVKVIWLDGTVTKIANPTIDTEITVSHKNAVKESSKEDDSNALFSEMTTSAFDQPFVHRENPFDDFKDQILLPHRMSTNGPFVSVADVNNDGLEDFHVGGAAGQPGQLFLQDNNGKFMVKATSAFEADKAYEDMGSVFFDADSDGDADLYVVIGGFEFLKNSPLYKDRLYINDGTGNFTKSRTTPNETSSGSCVTAGDIDGDGDQDLFVGGRVVPNRYPYPPKSFILINDKGTFTDKTADVAPQLSEIGMVTSATWSDFNKDGKQDLIVTGEWMSIRFFQNDGGKLTDASTAYLAEEKKGWWNTIVETDYDKDGDLDYIAGNVGLNHKFSASNEKPFEVYCDDFDSNGSYDIVLAKYIDKTQVPIRGKECSSQQMPFVSEKFPTYHAFANADLDDIYGEKLNEALKYQANWFATSILVNDNGKFRFEKLPVHAQLSPINGVIVGDFNNDQRNDLLLGGNLFGTEVETTRGDANIGLLLEMESDGSFSSASIRKSGFFVPYDVKDMKMIHIGKDKKKGILVASNNDALRLFVQNNVAVEL